MRKAYRPWIERNPVPSFFVLAYALSWVIQIPLALQAQGVMAERVPFSLHYLSAFGPMLAGFIITWRTSDVGGLRELLSRLGKWRVPPRWWVVALFPLIAMAVISLGLRLVRGTGLGIDELGQIDYFPSLGIGTMFLWIATFGLGEEAGWRGFALPRLQQGRSALSATLILWVLWALWHTPLFFYMYPLGILPGFLIGLLSGAITFTWIYNSTDGSVLMTILWHGLFNYGTACSVCKTGPSAAILSALVMILSVLIVMIAKPATLAWRGKHTLPDESQGGRSGERRGKVCFPTRQGEWN